MLTRRHFCCSGAIAGSLLTFDRAFAADQCAALTQERQSALNPDDALNKLKAGNERFVSQNMRNCDLLEQVRATAGGQFPSAVIVGCIDSRAPPELIFDQRIGDIFSARIAGNIVNDDIVGSSEFATKLAGCEIDRRARPQRVRRGQRGHRRRGTWRTDPALAKIRPAMEACKNAPGEHTSKNKEFVQQVAIANAKLAAENLTKTSEVLRNLVAAKQLKIVSAMHDVATGRVTFIE